MRVNPFTQRVWLREMGCQHMALAKVLRDLVSRVEDAVQGVMSTAEALAATGKPYWSYFANTF